MSSPSPGPSALAVVAIMSDGDTSLDLTLEAVAAQTFEPAAIVAVGAGARSLAGALGIGWEDSIRSLLDGLEPAITHVWMLDGGAVPAPDALYTLVFESERVQAGIAGSKLIDLDHTERLVSVGIATDIYEVPYIGLDDDELDAGQYDVLRDVAAIDGASVLARRDLLKGLGGPDPLLAPGAGAIDLSQRARIRGARVVVVPSSRVALPTRAAVARWREEAGRIRAMLKAYSLLTLLWALPARLLTGLVEAILAPFVGRWTLLAWVRSWLWNLFRLPSTLRARRAVQRNAVARDAELFRFQLRGSVALKSLWSELVETARARFPGEDRTGLASLGREVRRPAFGVALGAIFFSLLATRSLWSGLPAGGFSLPLPARGADAVAAYAGGWNPAGLGSTEQLPPFLGLAGLWQQLILDDPNGAAGSLLLVAFVGGIWGTARLLRTWSIEAVPGIFAGVALMAGPAARTIGGSGDVPSLVAIAVLPWILRAAVAPWPKEWLRRLARICGVVWASALLANVSPELLVVPAGALIVRALLEVRRGAAWRAAALATVGLAGALPLLQPWLGRVDLGLYLRSGDAFWSPGIALLVAALLAVAGVTLAGPGELWRIGLWGGMVGAAGGVIARMASEGGGRHVESLGLGAVALGTAIVVGASFEALRRIANISPVRRLFVAIGALGGAAIVISSLAVVAPGRGGLPADELAASLRFTDAAVEDSSSTRVLLIGPPDSMPGTSRRVRGAAYRVVSAPMPQLWEVELPEPGPGDAVLADVLASVIDGETFRAGEQLAEFGITWVLEMGETPLSATFVGQLDLIPLDGLPRTAFLVDSPAAVRALDAAGTAWRRTGTAYAGQPASEVLVRENSDPGWGADLVPEDWAMTLDGSSGMLSYERRAEQREARFSMWGGLGLAFLSAVLRRRR